MLRAVHVLVLSLGLAGCGSSLRSSFRPADGAPKLEPAGSAPQKVATPPGNAKDLGLVEVSGDESTSSYDCDQRMLEEARKAGANVFVVRFSEGGSASRPAGCHGEAYYVPGQ